MAAPVEHGNPVEIQLDPGGTGKWVVIIRSDNHEDFETVGSMSDPSRFPQRIKVAAGRTPGRVIRSVHHRERPEIGHRNDQA